MNDARTRLEASRDEIDARLAGLSKTPERGSGISFGKRIGDGTVEAVSRLTDVGVGHNLELQRERIQRALDKLDAGTYGICDSCGAQIAPRRLEVAPESVLCVECAGRA